MTPSFEEFKTARRRQRSMEQAEEADHPSRAKNHDHGKEDDSKSPSATDVTPFRFRRVRRSLEYSIENPNTQILVLLFIFVDLLLGSWSMVALLNSSDENSRSSTWNMAVDFSCTIILYLHCFELLLQMITFHVRFFSHWGYAIDTLLIITRILKRHSTWIDANHYHLHLLSFVRIWRMVRVIQTYIDIEEKHHSVTKKELSSQFKSIEEWKLKATLLQEDVEREKTLRAQIEDMAKGCREEMETLREALKIAAVDVAAAMGGKITREEGGIYVVEYDNQAEDDDNIKAWVTHPVQQNVTLGDVTEESSVD